MRTLRSLELGLVLVGLALPLVATSGCSESVRVHTATNPTASFDRYRTFSFGPAEGPPAGYKLSPLYAEVRRRAEPIVSEALAGQGYVPATAHADFYVEIGSGRRVVREHESADQITGGWVPDDENADFVEGALVIDAFDSATGERVWHGASRAEINPRRIDDGLLRSSVAELIRSFPAARTRSPAVAQASAR